MSVEAFLEYLFSYPKTRRLAVQVAWAYERRSAPAARSASR